MKNVARRAGDRGAAVGVRPVRLRRRRRSHGAGAAGDGVAAVGEEMIIAQGLSAGEEVVIDGQLRLTPGAQVDRRRRAGGGEGGRRAKARAAATAADAGRARRHEQGLTMNFAETFIRRPVATTLLVLTILIFGVMGYFRLPVADLPTVDYPIIQVNAEPAGRQPRHDGLVGGDAAREAVLDDLRHHRRSARAAARAAPTSR